MAEIKPAPEAPTQAPRRRTPWRAGLGWLSAVIAALALLVVGAILAIDTSAGHRFLIDRIEAFAPESGLRIKIGRIDGSIYNKARLSAVQIHDPKGLVFESPEIRLDWRPLAWLGNRLSIKDVQASRATLHKLPELNPSKKPTPLLPDFDIYIGSLSIDRLFIEPAITGERRIGKLSGSADIRSGRALVKFNAAVEGGGDRIALLLDAEPDRDTFELDLDVRSPAKGVIGGMIGTQKPVEALIKGDGNWSKWNGTIIARADRQNVADLKLDVARGQYTLSGYVAPSLIARGALTQLTAPRISVFGRGTFEKKLLNAEIALKSRALALTVKGGVNLGRSAFDMLRISANLLQPQVLAPGMSGKNIRLDALFNGRFDSAYFEYQLKAPRIAFDQTGFEDVQATGKGRLSKEPIVVPLRLTAWRVTGVGDVAGGILANLLVTGQFQITAKTIIGNDLQLRSDRLTSKINVLVDLVSGRYDVALSGQLNRYLIPGLGIVDVRADLSVVPGTGGKGARLMGTAQAWVRRLDNEFFRTLAGGLPVLSTGLDRGPDGIVHLRGLKLTAPAISLAGSGYRTLDGALHIEATGQQAQYGPFRLKLDGLIEKPEVEVFLAHPLDALGLKDVLIQLDPNADGFAYRASGGSLLGAFTSNGAIIIPSAQPTTIAIAALNVSETTARGSLKSLPGGFVGRLDLTGGVAGTLDFAPSSDVQRIAADLVARDARFAGPPELFIRRGIAKLDMLLDPDGTSVTGNVTARGLRLAGLQLAQLNADLALRGGTGQVSGSVSGMRGQGFALDGVIDITPDSYRISAEGEVAQRPIKFTAPAVLTRDGAGWRLAPTALSFAGGGIKASGRFGGAATELDASLNRIPLSILDMLIPDLGLGGSASGTLRYRQAEGASTPTGKVDLKVRGLSRSGLVLSSRPVDVGVTAVLDGQQAAGRAVFASGGKIIGRAQGRLAPIGNSGDLATRLNNAPLFAQLRFNGPADTLWRLTGVEIFDLSGTVAIGADVTGRLADPIIRGSVKTQDARMESAVTGTLLTNITANGRFDGSRLVVDSMTAKAGSDGSVSARGSFNLAAAEGFGMDLAVEAKRAVLLNRDDIGATVTGPLRIKTDGRGGIISGEVDLVASRFVLGQASAAQALPRLNVRELNRRGEEIEREAPAVPWRLAIKANARNRLAVTGLGLDSEWRADLDIGGTVEAPAIQGRADLVRGGYEFAGRRFDLERGTIRFNGLSPPDPTIDILAQSNVQGLNATIRVTGTGLRPEISFTSIPAMPEDELLSRLLFGTSITNLSAPEALQLAAAVAALQGGGDGGLNPINAVRKAAGLDRLRILPADTVTGQGTSIAAGKYVTRKTYVELITDGQGYSATRAEYQITRWLSILGSISTLGRQSINVRVSKDY